MQEESTTKPCSVKVSGDDAIPCADEAPTYEPSDSLPDRLEALAQLIRSDAAPVMMVVVDGPGLPKVEIHNPRGDLALMRDLLLAALVEIQEQEMAEIGRTLSEPSWGS